MEKKILIIGAGPTGLGAAWELKRENYSSFKVMEQNSYVGGLSASFKDDKGFTWDVGGHVLFSHYKYFDDLFEEVMQGQYLQHLRSSWIWIYDRFVPYPFQNNIRYLPKEILLECVLKLLEAREKYDASNIENFDDHLQSFFGQGIYRHFLKPYNDKVWAAPLNIMSRSWIGERVSPINIPRILENIILEKDDVSWGPNNKFKFPLYGGTGAIWNNMLPKLNGHVVLNKKITKLLWKEKKAVFNNAESEPYDILISSMPLNELVEILSPEITELTNAAKDLVWTSGLMIGVGINKPCPSDKCWMYFPMSDSPFYRVTYFSNYSPKNVPDANKHFSLMGEISYSSYRPFDLTMAVDETIRGMINSKLLSENDTKNIISTSLINVKYSYPVPTIKRDGALKTIIPNLESNKIFSRGRFGLWRYEIGNMDHSVMQGVELINRLLKNEPEKTLGNK